ncbi:hypothetical protein LRHMDP2_1078 [Lacticaseibacillus rhamnosus LRHMDP2]|uniref:Uncharacterized protein n=1 Tax=Lacticaseibacillus rhamnosus LRHMDP3 TaxID=1203259 RepID=A0AB33XXK5_LACRH|nr:hypothetical protein LRHMDP2_1078 [Lacticaseibacillus rhamnosus LRHMDP2]EKS53006.1 hypothetical protein LRHMDP3_384 [Lacticaseibacillus rhamnosus LRHMDP3]
MKAATHDGQKMPMMKYWFWRSKKPPEFDGFLKNYLEAAIFLRFAAF